jgi:hypothetical protein
LRYGTESASWSAQSLVPLYWICPCRKGKRAVRTVGTEERFSYRGEAREQERDPFEQFLTEVDRYEDLRVYCYGGSGRAFLRRVRKPARRKGPGTGCRAGW